MKTISKILLVMCALFITNISSMAFDPNRAGVGGQPNPVMNSAANIWTNIENDRNFCECGVAVTTSFKRLCECPVERLWGWEVEIIDEIEKTASVRLWETVDNWGRGFSMNIGNIWQINVGRGIDWWDDGRNIIVVPETVEFEGVEYTVTTWKAGTRILGWNERVDFATAPDFEIYIPSTLQAIEDSVFLRVRANEVSDPIGNSGLRAHFSFFFECEATWQYSIAYRRMIDGIRLNNLSFPFVVWRNEHYCEELDNWLDWFSYFNRDYANGGGFWTWTVNPNLSDVWFLDEVRETAERWGRNWFVEDRRQINNGRTAYIINRNFIWNRNCSHFCGNDYENCPNGCVPKEIEVCDECGLEDCECENNSVNVREVFSKIDFWVDGNVVRLNKEVSQISVFGVNGQLVAVGINANEIRIPNNGVHIVKVITREGQRAVQRVIVM